MRAKAFFKTVFICLWMSPVASASSFLFDFATTDRTFLGGPDSTPPDASGFVPTPEYPQTLFLVGGLVNGCGLYPGSGTRTGIGTDCSGVDPTKPGLTLSGTIDYDSGLDTFTLGQETEAVFQLIVKLGHPETENPQWRGQEQTETFDVFLKSPSATVELAELIDDVHSPEEDDAYYRYVYGPAVIPAGTWYPSFVGTSGSIDYLAKLSAVPEPSAIWLLGSGLGVLGLVIWRRRRSRY
jgi:hypothetical protein